MTDPDRLPRRMSNLHLLIRSTDTSSLCGRTPPPFPLAVVTTIEFDPSEVTQGFADSRAAHLLDPDTCPACVEGYYAWARTQP